MHSHRFQSWHDHDFQRLNTVDQTTARDKLLNLCSTQIILLLHNALTYGSSLNVSCSPINTLKSRDSENIVTNAKLKSLAGNCVCSLAVIYCYVTKILKQADASPRIIALLGKCISLCYQLTLNQTRVRSINLLQCVMRTDIQDSRQIRRP